jgi:hypothetical protein
MRFDSFEGELIIALDGLTGLVQQTGFLPGPCSRGTHRTIGGPTRSRAPVRRAKPA